MNNLLKEITTTLVTEADMLDNSNPWNSHYSFSDIMNEIEGCNDPQLGRNTMYYLFQTVHDLILDHEKTNLVWALEMVTQKAVDFYKSFYLQKPTLKPLKDLLYLKDLLIQYKEEFRMKERGNFDRIILPRRISSFIGEAINNTSPDVIVFIACSGAELAMPLAGILDKPLFFMRYSKRRHDGAVKYITPAYKEAMNNAVKGNNVLLIDDYADSGRSLDYCMTEIHNMGGFVTSATTAGGAFQYLLSDIETVKNLPTFKLYHHEEFS